MGCVWGSGNDIIAHMNFVIYIFSYFKVQCEPNLFPYSFNFVTKGANQGCSHTNRWSVIHSPYILVARRGNNVDLTLIVYVAILQVVVV